MTYDDDDSLSTVLSVDLLPKAGTAVTPLINTSINLTHNPSSCIPREISTTNISPIVATANPPTSKAAVAHLPMPSLSSHKAVAQSKVPSKFIDLNQKNREGEMIMTQILNHSLRAGGFQETLAHGKKGKFLKKIHDTYFTEDGILNQYKQPNIQYFQKTVSAALTLLSTLVSGHSHSPAEAEQGEDFPRHLTNMISLYQRVTENTIPVTQNVAQSNYAVQQQMVGIAAPLGGATNANVRASTRAINAKNGMPLVERDKNGAPYFGPPRSGETSSSNESDERGKDGSGKKKKKASNDVISILDGRNESSKQMSDAVVQLVSAVGKKRDNSGGGDEMDFKKGMWNDKKAHKDKKLDVKYGFLTEKMRMRNEQTVLTLLKENRNQAIEKFRSETNETLKEVYEEEVKVLSALYTKKLKEMCGNGN